MSELETRLEKVRHFQMFLKCHRSTSHTNTQAHKRRRGITCRWTVAAKSAVGVGGWSFFFHLTASRKCLQVLLPHHIVLLQRELHFVLLRRADLYSLLRAHAVKIYSFRSIHLIDVSHMLRFCSPMIRNKHKSKWLTTMLLVILRAQVPTLYFTIFKYKNKKTNTLTLPVKCHECDWFQLSRWNRKKPFPACMRCFPRD